jgi:hypothetical protein
MAAIPGTILSAKISPGDTNATFPTHEDIYGKGGLISVSNFSELSAIPLDRQKIGMTVHVNSDSQYYTLSSLSYPLTSYSTFFTKTLLVSGGNSNQWNSVYSYTNTNSSFDQVSRSFVNTNSAEILNSYNATSWVFANTAREIAVSTVVNNTSANWNYGYDVATYVQTNSALWEESAEIIPTVTNYLSTNNVLISSLNVFGNGTFDTIQASVKNFIIPHPTKKNKKLQYSSIESPYIGIQLTGEGYTKDGTDIVELPVYISSLIHENDVHIQLTNYGHSNSLYVDSIDIKNNQFIVKCSFIFGKFKTNKFFWLLTGVRKDVPKLKVEI